MTITEIVQTAIQKSYDFYRDMTPDDLNEFGLDIAKATTEECAKITDEYVPRIRCDSSYPVDVSATIRALAATPAGRKA